MHKIINVVYQYINVQNWKQYTIRIIPLWKHQEWDASLALFFQLFHALTLRWRIGDVSETVRAWNSPSSLTYTHLIYSPNAYLSLESIQLTNLFPFYITYSTSIACIFFSLPTPQACIFFYNYINYTTKINTSQHTACTFLSHNTSYTTR